MPLLLLVIVIFGSSTRWNLTAFQDGVWAYLQSMNKQIEVKKKQEKKAVSAWKLYRSCIEVDVFHC